MPDDALAAASNEYRLLRLHRLARREGPHGPGDLLWVWLLLGLLGAACVRLAAGMRKLRRQRPS